ncbi:L-idonate 5-dehydrogenase [Microbacterium sp. VKM Ac-2923]|uniref:L-idonate 5-dehydrogenase n=1 Tax=Microbacterium sp. VKM Ac-2923 TaxID=2929476 RepID=UPI001FB325F2|nr:L-idonate 5-dehydrogenase [Microbacterium sp. VKM Ac-2923]MCJ1706974.1 L-idonate 5-dehydrogenase [Microbacterium sp. VKM Ac-2923]
MTNFAVVAHAADDLRVEDIDEPIPDADEAVIAVAYGGVCGSDLHYWRHGAAGASILREPLVLGHELAGTVVRAAADGSGPSVGTPVAVHPLTPRGDGVTPWPEDRPQLAPASTYLGSAMHLPHTQGGFAERVALPTRMLFPLPPGLDLRVAVLAEPAAVAWHAVSQAGAVAGRRVAVIGAGPIGQLAVAVARHRGAADVIATDLHELPRSLAEARGARALDARDDQATAQLHADVVIESSGTAPGLASAIATARRGGTVVLLGLQAAGGVPAPLATAITRELTLVGSFRFGDEFAEVIAALADGSLDVEGIITHVIPVADALSAFATAADSSVSSKVALSFA